MKIVTHADTYQRITDFVIEQMEKGKVIWQQPWNEMGMPRNSITHRPYQGFNAFLLNFITSYHGYKSPLFITYKQALAAGGTVKRGEKGNMVIWWATLSDNRSKNNVEENESRTYRVPKCHTVFNLDQTRGIEIPKLENNLRSHVAKIDACESVLQKMPSRPVIRHGGDKAYYHPVNDYIMLPAIERFHSDEAYYKTAFHELAHSTGHATRLNRKELVESDGFGNELYGKEELTAEMTAAYLGWHLPHRSADHH